MEVYLSDKSSYSHKWSREPYANGVHISEVPKFLAESPSVTTYAIELPDPLDAAHPWFIPL